MTRRKPRSSPAWPLPAPVEVRRIPTTRVNVEGAQCALCGRELSFGGFAIVTPGGVLAHPFCGVGS